MGDAKTHRQYHHHPCQPMPGALRMPSQAGCGDAAELSPQHIPYPLPGNPPCPVRHSGPCPESSSVPDPVSPGQSGGSQPCCLAPLCVSSQADYCPWANILIEGSRQAIAPGIPYSPSCHFPPSWRVRGSAEALGAQQSTGSWKWSRFLEVQQDCRGLGYPGKGFFPLPADALLPPPQPGELGASFQPHSVSFLRQKGHTKKPITQPSAPKRGRKSPEQVWALGRNTA